MTKIEYGKCVKLMEEAIRKAKQSNEEYKAYNQLLNKDYLYLDNGMKTNVNNCVLA